MYYFQKFTKTVLSLIIIVTGLLFVDREIVMHDPVAQGLVKVAKTVDPRQLVCMAENIFYEAGSEGPLGQAAVARVVMNRISHGFASTPCGVIHQKTIVTDSEAGVEKKICQFSWTCADVDKINPSDPGYQRSKRIAYEVLAYDSYSTVVPKSTLFFHNTSVKPNWPYHAVAKIDNHIFYSKYKIKSKTNEQPRKGS